MSLRQRFGGEAAAASVLAYSASLAYDRRLARYDIQGSIAYARALARAGVINDEDAGLIVVGLDEIRGEIERGEFRYRDDLEDIHMNVEARLIERVGDAGGRLHTGRSRNDQVATDLRLYLKDAIEQTEEALASFQRALLELAERNPDVALPGYTHLQRAQPVLLAHHLLAYFEMARRDRERFAACRERVDVMPLGAGALAGTGFALDREALAHDLGFARVSRNSMDAVSDRDFVVEYEAAAALTMTHLSRLAEELVLWSSKEFAFVNIADDFSTSSSMMPQKRNPDVAELARGKTGRILGHLMATLVMLKGLPLTYSRDLQEDKEAVFDTVDTLLPTLDVVAAMVASLHVHPGAMAAALERGHLLATDVADYLVRKGLPFREAHGLVARLVAHAEGEGLDLRQLPLAAYRRFSPLFDADITKLDAARALAQREAVGGTAPLRVEAALVEARSWLEGSRG